MIQGAHHLLSVIFIEGPRPQPPSYHRPPTPLTVEYSASTLARGGVFPARWRYLQPRELPRRRQGVTLPSAPNAPFQPLDKLTTRVTLLLTGIARISPLDRTLAGQTALARLGGLDRFPCRDPRDHGLGRVTAWHSSSWTPSLGGLSTSRPGAIRAQGAPTATWRSNRPRGQSGRGRPPATTPTPRAGTAPRGPGRSPPGGLWHQVFRGGTAGQSLVKPAHEARRQPMPHLALLRLDDGFRSAQVLTLLGSPHVGFLVKAGTTRVSVHAWVERTGAEPGPSDPQDTRRGRWNRVQWLDGDRPPVTVVLVECRRLKRMRKGRLSWKSRTGPSAIVTDPPPGPTAKSSETSKACWAGENFCTESNWSFSWGERPSGRFRGHQFFRARLGVVSNRRQFFQRACLPRGCLPVSFAPGRRDLLAQAVGIQERAEAEIPWVLNEDDPLRREANLLLRKAVAA